MTALVKSCCQPIVAPAKFYHPFVRDCFGVHVTAGYWLRGLSWLCERGRVSCVFSCYRLHVTVDIVMFHMLYHVFWVVCNASKVPLVALYSSLRDVSHVIIGILRYVRGAPALEQVRLERLYELGLSSDRYQNSGYTHTVVVAVPSRVLVCLCAYFYGSSGKPPPKRQPYYSRF